jgi:hypothetical protein
MEAPPADLQQRLAAAGRCSALLTRAARTRRLAAQRRYLLLHRPALERQLAATERRVRLPRLVMLGRALAILASPALVLMGSLGTAPAADQNLLGLPYAFLTIALLTVVLFPFACRPYVLLTRALLIRALLTYALLEGADRAGDLLIRSILRKEREDQLTRWPIDLDR